MWNDCSHRESIRLLQDFGQQGKEMFEECVGFLYLSLSAPFLVHCVGCPTNRSQFKVSLQIQEIDLSSRYRTAIDVFNVVMGLLPVLFLRISDCPMMLSALV